MSSQVRSWVLCGKLRPNLIVLNFRTSSRRAESIKKGQARKKAGITNPADSFATNAARREFVIYRKAKSKDPISALNAMLIVSETFWRKNMSTAPSHAFRAYKAAGLLQPEGFQKVFAFYSLEDTNLSRSGTTCISTIVPSPLTKRFFRR